MPVTDRRRFLTLTAAAIGLPAPARAQQPAAAYPGSRPLHIIVPFAAGGGPDLLVRKLAPRLTQAFGPEAVIVVENVVGAGGIVAAQNVARSAPDGLSLLLGASSHVVQKAMQPSVRFDPLKDFTHIGRVATSSSVLVVAADSPYRSLDDLLAAARQAPGRLNYASGGVGSAAHLCAAALLVHAGLQALHVPYKGSVEIVPSIIAGDTQFAFPIAATAVPQVRGGKVRALAVTGTQRMAALPDVPTLAELRRASELVLDAWFGLWAPAGTPPTVVQAVHRAVQLASDDTNFRSEIEASGSLVATSVSPAEFTRFIEAETQKFTRLVKAARLTVSG